MSGIITGAKTIGMSSGSLPVATLPNNAEDPFQIIEQLLSEFDNMKTLVEGKADAGRLKTLIQYSDEAIRIQAENIALVGAVTFLDVWRDQTGQVIGGVHPSLTRIRGGVIQTGVIISSNLSEIAGSAFNLDTGELLIGGTSSPKLHFNPETNSLTISGTLAAADGVFTGDVITGGQVTITGQHTSGGQLAALHVVPVGGGQCIYLNSGESVSPTLQISRLGATTGFGIVVQGTSGGIVVSANAANGSAITASAVGSATTAIRINLGDLVMGAAAGSIILDTKKIIKTRQTGHYIRLFEPGGGPEIAGSPLEYEFE